MTAHPVDLVELVVDLERFMHEEAKQFVVVTVLCATGEPVNSEGPFPQAEMALVAATRGDADWVKDSTPGDGEFKSFVIPLWEPST